jgi:hypothetical protein
VMSVRHRPRLVRDCSWAPPDGPGPCQPVTASELRHCCGSAGCRGQAACAVRVPGLALRLPGPGWQPEHGMIISVKLNARHAPAAGLGPGPSSSQLRLRLAAVPVTVTVTFTGKGPGPGAGGPGSSGF